MPVELYGPHNAPRDLFVPDLNWEQLEQVTHLHFTAPQRSELVKSLNEFVMGRSRAEDAPDLPKVRQRLQNIGHAARTLARWLHDDSPVGNTALDYLRYPWPQIDDITFIHDLWRLDLCTKAGLNDLSDLRANAGHPDRSRALEPLILAWHGMYRQAGGPRRGCYKDIDTHTYRGRFLDLLDEALAQAATVLTTWPSRNDPVFQQRQEKAKKHLTKMIHIPRVTLAKRIEKVLKKHPS
jgi:hypothetical protein